MSGIIGFTNRLKTGVIHASAPSFCMVSGGQSINSGTWTQVSYDTTVHDNTGGASLSNNAFIVPVGGVWHFEFHARVGGMDDNEDMIVQFRLNGTSFTEPNSHAHSWSTGSGRTIDNELNFIVDVTAGSVISAWSAQNEGGAVTYAADYTFLAGSKLI